MCERLREGQVVTMLFGGISMLPLINGNGDKIKLRPLEEGEACVPGEVYLFFHNNHYIIHRLMRIKDGVHIFRGDNCFNCERETRENVLAKLVTIIQTNGNEVDCESTEWRKQSKRVARRRTVRNFIIRLTHFPARRKAGIAYFVLLAALMWAPLNGLGEALNNYIFGLRLDHLLHALVYLFCPLFLTSWLHRSKIPLLAVSVLIGIATESVQYLLPYRGFDVNDLVANFIGVLLGWLAIMFLLLRRKKQILHK